MILAEGIYSDVAISVPHSYAGIHYIWPNHWITENIRFCIIITQVGLYHSVCSDG
jgi:hypothetical protein